MLQAPFRSAQDEDVNRLAWQQTLERRLTALEIALARGWSAKPRSAQSKAEEAAPTIADLLMHLPKLSVTSDGRVDFAGSNPAVLVMLGTNAEIVCQLVLRGVAAMGGVISHVGPEIEDGSLTSHEIESLGSLLKELGELSGILLGLTGNCRQ